MLLVGFIIRMYHDARSSECQVNIIDVCSVENPWNFMNYFVMKWLNTYTFVFSSQNYTNCLIMATWRPEPEDVAAEQITVKERCANCAICLHYVESCLTFWRRNYFFLILAHPVYKIWIIQEPNTLELWNKLHFEEEKEGEYIPCLKYSVPIFVE